MSFSRRHRLLTGVSAIAIISGLMAVAPVSRVEATDIVIDGSDQTVSGNITTIEFLSDDTATIDAAATVSGTVTNATGTDNQGTVDINADGQTVTFDAALGADNAALKTVTVSNGTGDFNGAVSAATIDVTNGTVTFAEDVTTTGTSGLAIASGQTVTFDGSAAQVVSGDVTGAGAGAVANNKGVTFNDDVGVALTATGGDVTFLGNAAAITLSFAGDQATFDGSNQQTVSGAVDGLGVVIIENDTVFEGQVSTSEIRIRAGETAEFQNGSGPIDFSGTGTGTALFTTRAQTAGVITTKTDGAGTVAARAGAGNTVAFSTIGESGTSIDTLNIGDSTEAGNASFSGDVFAADVNVGVTGNTGTADFNGAVSAATIDVTNGTVTFAEDVTTTGTSGLAIASGQTATFDGTDGSEVSGVVTGDGTAVVSSSTIFKNAVSVAKTQVAGGKTAEFQSGAAAVEFTGDGTASFTTASQTVTDAVTTTASGNGTVEIDAAGGTVTFNAALGADNAALKTVTVTNGTGDFNGAVFAESIDLSDSASFAANVTTTSGLDIADTKTVTFDGSAAQVVSGGVTGAGTGAVTNNKGVTFNENVGVALTATGGDMIFLGDASTITLTNSGDNATFRGTEKQTVTGAVSGDGAVIVDNDTVFEQEVSADEVRIRAGDTAEFQNGAGSIDFSGSGTGTALFTTSAQSTGAITTERADEGTVTARAGAGNTVAFSTIGESGTSIGTLNIGDSTEAGNASFSGDVFAANVNVGSSTAGSVASFVEKVYAKTLAVASGSIARFTKAFVSDNTTVTGKMAVSATGNAAGAFTTNTGAEIDLGPNIDDGDTVFTVTSLTLAQGTKVNIDTSANSKFGHGDIAVLFDADAADISAQGTNLVFNSTDDLLYQVARNNGDNTVIRIGAYSRDAETYKRDLPADSEFRGVVDGVFAAMTRGGELESALMPILANGGAPAEEALEQLGIQMDTASAGSAVAVQTGMESLSIVSNRLIAMREGGSALAAANAGSVVGADDNPLASAVWLKPFYQDVDQDRRGQVDGFDAQTAGIAFGIDTRATDEARIGLAGSWARSDVDGEGAGSSTLDIDSYQASLYGDYDLGGVYVDGFVGYARNNMDSSRVIDFGTLTARTATASFNSDQYMIGVGAATRLNFDDGVFVRPKAGLTWTHVKTDDYTETGAGGVNQSVSTDDIDVVLATVGATVGADLPLAGGTITPEASLGVGYDFAGDEAVATGRFTGGGAAFTQTGAEVEQFGVNAGFGMTWELDEYSVGAIYDVEHKEDYLSQSGQIEFKLKF